jgi:hypothetical protein
MSVRHPIAEMRAAIAGRRFGVIRVAFAMPATRPLYAQSPTFRCFGAIDALVQERIYRRDRSHGGSGRHAVKSSSMKDRTFGDRWRLDG